MRPGLDKNRPVNVGITLHIMAIPKVDEENLEFHLDMYFRQFWQDDRLAFGNRGSTPRNLANVRSASLKEYQRSR